MNPNVNYRLWVIMMCQHRLINYNKWATLVGDADNRGSGARWWGEEYLETLCTIPYFAMNLKPFQ